MISFFCNLNVEHGSVENLLTKVRPIVYSPEYIPSSLLKPYAGKK